MWDLLATNKEWIFSGVGVVVAVAVISVIWRFRRGKGTQRMLWPGPLPGPLPGDASGESLDQLVDKLTDLELSIAHPKLLSKRFSTLFLVTIYPQKERKRVEGIVAQELQDYQDQGISEHVDDTDLVPGLTVIITAIPGPERKVQSFRAKMGQF